MSGPEFTPLDIAPLGSAVAKSEFLINTWLDDQIAAPIRDLDLDKLDRATRILQRVTSIRKTMIIMPTLVPKDPRQETTEESSAEADRLAKIIDELINDKA